MWSSKHLSHSEKSQYGSFTVRQSCGKECFWWFFKLGPPTCTISTQCSPEEPQTIISLSNNLSGVMPWTVWNISLVKLFMQHITTHLSTCYLHVCLHPNVTEGLTRHTVTSWPETRVSLLETSRSWILREVSRCSKTTEGEFTESQTSRADASSRL